MKIIAIVGTGSGSGKTTVACRILRAVPGLGAVKISPRDGAEVRVERGRGTAGKDTDCYAAAGAVSVARIVAPRGEAAGAWRRLEGDFSNVPGVLVEGSGSLDLPGERIAVLVADRTFIDRMERNSTIASLADMIIISSSTESEICAEIVASAPHLDSSRIMVLKAGDVDCAKSWQPLTALVRDFLDGRTSHAE